MKGWTAALAALALLPAAAPATAKCQLGQVAALPVHLAGSRIYVDAEINGQPVELMLDTGAQTTMVLAGVAQRLGIVLSDAMASASMYGAGGSFGARLVRVRELKLGDARLTNLVFWATGRPGSSSGADSKVAMILGEDVLEKFDVEYDLTHGAVRLLHPSGCTGDQVAYWTDRYAKARMQPAPGGGAVISVDVGLNHASATATMDTGAPETVITPEAAMRAGVLHRQAATNARLNGLGSYDSGIGLVELDTFSLGEEVIRHPKLQVADMFSHNVMDRTGSLLGERVDMPDMLLGLDFVRSHRILVAPDQHMIYFTYAGGPVFEPPRGPAGTGAQ